MEMKRRKPFLYPDLGGQLGAKQPKGRAPFRADFPSPDRGVRVLLGGGPAQLPGNCAWLPLRRAKLGNNPRAGDSETETWCSVRESDGPSKREKKNRTRNAECKKPGGPSSLRLVKASTDEWRCCPTVCTPSARHNWNNSDGKGTIGMRRSCCAMPIALGWRSGFPRGS